MSPSAYLQQMAKTRFGFDLGTNSIGWAVLGLGKDGEPERILGSGVRIFMDGRDPKSLTSLKASRTRARQARRMRDRYKQRRAFLMSELVKHGLMPKDVTERKGLEKLDPYFLRAKALEKKLEPYELGRALFHLNQRRGFKSNRKSADGEDGVVRSSVKELKNTLKKKGVRTLGEYLAKRRKFPATKPKNPDTVRARRRGSKTSDLYDLYPSRAMLEEEFDLIWEAQASFDSKKYTDELRNQLRSAIFFQRPLKPQPVGRCTLIPDEPRAPNALPSAQRFRILQEVNNLQWIDHEGIGHMIREDKDLRDHIVDKLEKSRKRTFAQIAKDVAKFDEYADSAVQFNLQSETRDFLKGNITSCEMSSDKRFGKKWHDFPLAKQDEIINLIMDSEKEDDEVTSELMEKHGLAKDKADAVMNAKIPQPHGKLSAMAMGKLLPLMEKQRLQYRDAVEKADLGSHSDMAYRGELLDELPYYGEICKGDVVGEGQKEDGTEEERYGSIPNPTVHIALNQLRRVYNDLVRFHGAPAEVVLEVARDLPMGVEGKRELSKRQKENQERNDHARSILERYGQDDNRHNRQRVLLWEELDKDPTGRICPFSGDQISINKLFTDAVEVEHLLPYSRTLDDSLANKTLVTRQANRDKGNRTPHEAFGNSPKGYAWEQIFARAERFPKNKFWRFKSDAMKRYEENGGFLARQLNDTRYISRIAEEYLQCVVPHNKIWVVTGHLTALLRAYWGMNSILRDLSGSPIKDDAPAVKNRDDHRHHAIDALVIAMISRSMLQRVARAAEHAEKINAERLFSDDERFDPWEGFRDSALESVGQIIVSHRRRKKDQGQLHNETAYGLVNGIDGDGPQSVVHRVPLTALDGQKAIAKIKDNKIRNELIRVTEGLDGKTEIVKAVTKWGDEKGIRRVKIIEKLTVIPMSDKSGKVYKAYMGDSNAYYDIFRIPQSDKYDGEIVSTFDANQKGFIPNWQKKYPTAHLVMRLRMNDMIEMEHEGKRKFMRVRKLSKGIITLVEHMKVTEIGRNHAPSKLKKANAVFVHISPSGRVMRRNRDGSGPPC